MTCTASGRVRDYLWYIFSISRRLVFKGGENDKAVLCSDDKTYEVKEAETSNSLVLVPNLKFPEDLKNINEDDMIVDHKTVSFLTSFESIEWRYSLIISNLMFRAPSLWNYYPINHSYFSDRRCFSYVLGTETLQTESE